VAKAVKPKKEVIIYVVHDDQIVECLDDLAEYDDGTKVEVFVRTAVKKLRIGKPTLE
jgi:hypothetical protein